MWETLSTLSVVLQPLSAAFTQPSFHTHQQLVLAWVMCLGNRTEFQVFEAVAGVRSPRAFQHSFDRFYNFFNRSAWQLSTLACCVATQVVLRFYRTGEIWLVADGTLLHKSGKHVHMAGWFYDGNASTKTRLATRRGNKWIVIGILVQLPRTDRMICLPIHARLQPPGKGVSSEAEITDILLNEIYEWFPERKFLLIADGGLSSAKLLSKLDERVRYVGVMRMNAAIHERLKTPKKRKPGRPAHKGKRIKGPSERFAELDKGKRPKHWTEIEARGITYLVYTFYATWPRVLKNRSIKVVLAYPLADHGEYKNLCLFTTDLDADAKWVIETYALRPTIETAFRSSKQALQIEKPKHWSVSTVEKLAPWVWLTQTTIVLWYLEHGQKTPEALQARRSMGEWESEWSLEFMMRLLRRLTIQETINATPSKHAELRKLCESLESYLYMAS